MADKQVMCVECGRMVAEIEPVDGWCAECVQKFDASVMQLVCGDSKLPETVAANDSMLNGETCDWCDAPLRGSLIVTTGVIGNVGIIRLTEANLRNWILCDGCNAMICHACAPDWQTGYCPNCIRDQRLDEEYEEALRRNR